MTGRPRDPQLGDRIEKSAVTILAVHRMPGFTSAELAAHAGVGKASIYRRWRSTTAILADVIEHQLGVPDDFDFGGWHFDQQDTPTDIGSLLTAACTGVNALAEAALLPHVGLFDELRAAYFAGPARRLQHAASMAADRAAGRGEGVWSSLEPIRAGHALLLQRIQVSGLQPSPAHIRGVVDVILPGLAGSTYARRSAATKAPSTAGSITGGTS